MERFLAFLWLRAANLKLPVTYNFTRYIQWHFEKWSNKSNCFLSFILDNVSILQRNNQTKYTWVNTVYWPTDETYTTCKSIMISYKITFGFKDALTGNVEFSLAAIKHHCVQLYNYELVCFVSSQSLFVFGLLPFWTHI